MITKLTIAFPSLALLRPVEVIVGLPTFFSLAKTPLKCIWALHCAMESAAFFFDKLDSGSIIEREKVAVVAPSLGNGYFLNSDYEAQADFLDELATQLPQILPLSPHKADNGVIGVSMGGFGAIRWALASGRFGRAVAISGVFNCHLTEDERIYRQRELKTIFLAFKKIMNKCLLTASGSTRADADLDCLARNAKSETEIGLYCGKEDYLSLNQTLWLKEVLDNMAIPVQLELLPGAHDSDFWKKAFHLAAEDIFKPDKTNAEY